MTRGAAVRAAAARLTAAGIPTPALDARLLALEAFRVTLAGLVASAGDAASPAEIATLDALATRRLSGEPVARILGRWEFWGLEFALSPDTLVPRPDSETVVEAALAAIGAAARAPRILDLGVGSGCLLLALLAERPDAVGTGVDRSIEATATARENAAALGFADRADFAVGDWASALRGPFDLVVSNPPYIPSRAIADLAREVRAHDPARALDGGPDGLSAYGAILADLPRLLGSEGVAVLELGFGQEADVAALALAAGLRVDGPAKRDLGGVARALTVRPRPGG